MRCLKKLLALLTLLRLTNRLWLASNYGYALAWQEVKSVIFSRNSQSTSMTIRWPFATQSFFPTFFGI